MNYCSSWNHLLPLKLVDSHPPSDNTAHVTSTWMKSVLTRPVIRASNISLFWGSNPSISTRRNILIKCWHEHCTVHVTQPYNTTKGRAICGFLFVQPVGWLLVDFKILRVYFASFRLPYGCIPCNWTHVQLHTRNHLLEYLSNTKHIYDTDRLFLV